MTVYPLSFVAMLAITLLAEEVSGRKGWAVVRLFLFYPSFALPFGPELAIAF